MEKVAVMNENLELDRLAKENDNFKKIIQTQQNTINRMIDYFILGEKKAGLQKYLFSCDDAIISTQKTIFYNT